MRRPGFVLLLILATVCVPPTLAGGLDTYTALRDARPDGRTVTVEDVTLQRDVYTLRFKGGTFHLLQPVDGKTLGAVYIGDGEFRLEPATESERRHLAFRAKQDGLEVLTDTFDRMVLLFSDDTAEEILGGNAPVAGTPGSGAKDLYENYLRWQRKDLETNVHLQVVADLLNDHGRPEGAFYAFFRGKEFERGLVSVNPMGLLDDEESCFMIWRQEEIEYWYSSHLAREVKSGLSDNCRVKLWADASHYEVDTTVVRANEIEGTTTIQFSVNVPELNVLPFDLFPFLRIQEAVRLVSDEAEEPVPLGFAQEARREDADPALFLDRPLRRGETATIRIRYDENRGENFGEQVVDDDGDGIYMVTARASWYPNLEPFADHATYDLTFRVPKGNTVVSVGKQVSTRDDGEQSVVQWKADFPLEVAGFNYGVFKTLEQTESNSGMTVRVFTNPGTPDIIDEINDELRASSTIGTTRDAAALAMDDSVGAVYTMINPTNITISPEMLADSAMADTVNSVQVYTRAFGPLPNRSVSISQQSQWCFGQSWPTLIFMPYVASLDATTRSQLGMASVGTTEFLDQVCIHEVAHQWWGNHVGIESYRDNWLSEGFAQFSTALVLETMHGQEAADHYWFRLRQYLLSKPADGGVRHVNAGPVTLGFRSSTRRSEMASRFLVYEKGAFILHMLRALMRDEKAENPEAAFFGMMQDFAKTYGGKTASTEDFKAMVEKHMVPNLNATGDGKIDWFFDQWVYGTEVPAYRTDVSIEKAGKGKYRLHGTISQENVSDEFLAMVPVYVDFGKGQYAMIGRAPFKGRRSQNLDITLDLPKKPKDVVVNAHYEVLAWDPAKGKKKKKGG